MAEAPSNGGSSGSGMEDPDALAAAGEPAAGAEESMLRGNAEERLTWRKNATVLYDLFICSRLDWPALSVAWLPDEDDVGCRLAFGTHTDCSSSCEVVVAELACSPLSEIGADPWESWPCGGLGDEEGFGCEPLTEDTSPLRPIARMRHPTEVNKLAPCPQRPQLLATKAATGAVYLFDYRAERPKDQVSPDACLEMAEPVDGFALAWSRVRQQVLASGGNDGQMAIWDAGASLKAKPQPLHRFQAHKGAMCDVSFSCHEPDVLVSVGDDARLCLWDLRCGPGDKPQLDIKASDDEVLGVDCSHHRERWVATSGKDGQVRIWDVRAPASPAHSLIGHKQDAVVVRWAPFRDSLLGSCSADSRLCLWNLDGKEKDAEPGEEVEPPELLFSHAGHTQGVSDFSWGNDDYLLSSVAEDNTLQVWQPSTVFYLDDSDNEQPAEPAVKKTRS